MGSSGADWRHDEAFVATAVGLIAAGRAAEVYHALERPGGPPVRDAIVFLKDVFLVLSQHKAHEAILGAALKAPANSLLALIPTYFAACILLERRNFEQGFALLSAFRGGCLQNLGALPTDDVGGFMVLFRHALLVNDERYLDTPYFRDNLAINRDALGPLCGLTPAEPGGSEILMVSCDQRYADLFLPRFLDSVEEQCRDRLIHVHLMDPAAESPSPAEVPALRNNRLALSWERSGALKCSAYYASARFLRIGDLLRHYQRPIVIFDADVALRHPVEPVTAALRDADFAAFRMDRLDPASVWQASVTGFQPTAAGLELAEVIRDLILSKLSIQRPLLWLVDQAALYSAIHIQAEVRHRLRVADLTQWLGLGVTEYVAFHDGSIDKLKLMVEAGGAPTTPVVRTSDR